MTAGNVPALYIYPSLHGWPAREILSLENESPLNCVVVFEVNVLLQCGIVHSVLGRLGHVCRRTGDGRKYGIAQRRHRAVGTPEGLHFTVRDVADPQGSLAFRDFNSDRRAL